MALQLAALARIGLWPGAMSVEERRELNGRADTPTLLGDRVGVTSVPELPFLAIYEVEAGRLDEARTLLAESLESSRLAVQEGTRAHLGDIRGST